LKHIDVAQPIYLILEAMDMRKAINGLSIMVSTRLKLDPFSRQLFVFSNRVRMVIKFIQSAEI